MLRLPEARVLRCLMPDDPTDPIFDWPLLPRPVLNQRAGFTERSGSLTRALNGGFVSAGDTRRTRGLIERGFILLTVVNVEGVREDNFRITPEGVLAYQKYIAEEGEPFKMREASSCVNKRYGFNLEKKEKGGTSSSHYPPLGQ